MVNSMKMVVIHDLQCIQLYDLTLLHSELLRLFVSNFLVAKVLSLTDYAENKQTLFSGGRPEASKRNLNFQSTTWHQF